MISLVEAGPRTNPELNEKVGAWISYEIFGDPHALRDFSTMAVFDGPTLIAGMAFHNWHPKEGVIEISGAGITPRWLTRAALKRLFGFPFDQLGCQLVVMRVPATNHRLIRMLRRFGFETVVIPRLRGRTEDEAICTLTDDAWRSRNG